MAKKPTKPNLPQDLLDRARREIAQNGDVIEAAPMASSDPDVKKAAPRRVFVPTTNLQSQYAYVLLDLRNMATLAVGLAAILIVLSFVI